MKRARHLHSCRPLHRLQQTRCEVAISLYQHVCVCVCVCVRVCVGTGAGGGYGLHACSKTFKHAYICFFLFFCFYSIGFVIVELVVVGFIVAGFARS